VIPAKPGSVAALQFDLLSAAPFALTSDDVLWQVACARKGTDPADATARDAFFAKPQACLRASPLVKTHGWALRHDAQGRVALVDPGTADYAAAVADPGLTKSPGMRNARA
jgi:hypothetical protein